jgi:hypothetical protein
MVIVFDDHMAFTPVGNPLAPDTPLFDISVTPVVAWVILVMTVVIQTVWVEEATLAPFTVIVPVALALPQPPVSGML